MFLNEKILPNYRQGGGSGVRETCIWLLPMEVFSNADISFCFSHSEEVLEFCETLFGYLPLLQWKCSWLIRFCRIIIVREEVLEFARL